MRIAGSEPAQLQSAARGDARPKSCQQPHARGQGDGLEQPRWGIALGIAICQRERRQPVSEVCGNDLRDGATRVVGHQVESFQSQMIAEFDDSPRQARQGHIGVWVSRRGVPMPGQVDGDAAPLLAGRRGDDVAPQETVGEDAVDEQRGSALSNIEVTCRAR